MTNERRGPALTVDAILLDGEEGLLLVERGKEPYVGSYALPGGFVEYGETVEEAVLRELEEETGIKASIEELFGVYSSPDRDPRGHMVSVVFTVRREGGRLQAGDDAAKARFFPLEGLPELAFDHGDILRDLLERRETDR